MVLWWGGRFRKIACSAAASNPLALCSKLSCLLYVAGELISRKFCARLRLHGSAAWRCCYNRQFMTCREDPLFTRTELVVKVMYPLLDTNHFFGVATRSNLLWEVMMADTQQLKMIIFSISLPARHNKQREFNRINDSWSPELFLSGIITAAKSINGTNALRIYRIIG